MRRTVFLAALLLLTAGCAGGDEPAAASRSQTGAAATGDVAGATAAAAVANAIAANPAGADSILQAAGYTAESFKKRLYEIAADSTQAAAYAGARVD